MNNLFAQVSTGKNSQRGFTLLLAALIASIVLAIGTAVFDIAQKELILSSAGRNSQFAFYAADSASECALFWDTRYQYFATSTPTLSPEPFCDGQTLAVSPTYTPSSPASYPYTMSFWYASTDSGGQYYCADVSVTKSQGVQLGSVDTVVHADGYSTAVGSPSACDPPQPNTLPSAIAADPQALQRSVELHY